MAKPKDTQETFEIQPIATRTIVVKIVGTTPFIMHRFAKKAWEELLYPSGRKTASVRANSMKHNPMEEYQGCFYLNRDQRTPTLFHLPEGMLHKALASAAMDVPGPASRAQMTRLTSVGPQINLYGVPMLHMAMVRSSDMAKTPDVRTRPIFPKWACEIEISFVINPLNDAAILNLLGAAGVIVGIGDGRPQKGLSFGRFKIVSDDDPEFAEIVANGGRKAQQRAFENPSAFDVEAEELMAWFTAEVARRRQEEGGMPARKTRAAKPNGTEMEMVQ